MIMSESHVLGTLAHIVVEDAEAAARRIEDRALNQARDLVQDAHDRLDDLTRAARDLGRTRGQAAERAEAEAAEREVAGVEAGALDALAERFLRRVTLALEGLPGADPTRYGRALAAWARAAPSKLDAPAEVFTAKRDRRAVYEALLAAGATDFHVRIDHRVHVGFVARDLDGRTLHDSRPAALVEAHAAALRTLLEGRVARPPALAKAATQAEQTRS